MLKNVLIVGFCTVSSISFSQKEEEVKPEIKPIQATKIVKVERLERASKIKAAPIQGKRVTSVPKNEAIQPKENESSVKKD